MGWSNTLRWGEYCCLQKSKEPQETLCLFSSCRRDQMQPLILRLRIDISTSYTIRPLRISLLWKALELLSNLFLTLWHINVLLTSLKVVATSCSLGPISIISSIPWASVYLEEEGSLWTRLWLRAGELIGPWRGTVKVYWYPCQMKANCFWWALWTGMEEKAFARSIVTIWVAREATSYQGMC